MNPSDALAFCYEYNFDDPQLEYSLAFTFEEGQKSCYEQDPGKVWSTDYSGVFYGQGQPEFEALRTRAQFPEDDYLRVTFLGEFPGRESNAVRVQMAGTLLQIMNYGKRIGVDFVVPEGSPVTSECRLVFDSDEGVNSRYAIEFIGASFITHPRAAEVQAAFERDVAENFNVNEINTYTNHVKVPLTPDCNFNYKGYIRVDRKTE